MANKGSLPYKGMTLEYEYVVVANTSPHAFCQIYGWTGESRNCSAVRPDAHASVTDTMSVQRLL